MGNFLTVGSTIQLRSKRMNTYMDTGFEAGDNDLARNNVDELGKFAQ